MPFAGYSDFGECTSANSDKNDPGAYCAAIQRQAEKLEDDELPEPVSIGKSSFEDHELDFMAMETDEWEKAMDDNHQVWIANDGTTVYKAGSPQPPSKQEILNMLSKQDDPEKICGHTWFNVMGNDERPDGDWWDDCIDSVKETL